jgi:uncharacterized protein YggE
MRYALFFALFLVTSGLFAQEGFKGEHFIEVTGVAETEIDPNEITLLIRLREFEANKSKVQLEKLDQDFLAALKAAGIDKKRLTLAGAGSSLSKFGKRDKDAFRDKVYQLILTNAGELEKLIEKLEPVEVDRLVVSKVHHTEYEKYKLDLKIQALKAAKAKAEAMLKAIGSEAGIPLMVREWDNDPVHPYDMNANVMLRTKNQSMGMEEMEEPQQDSGPSFRKIKLRSQVSAQFAIK